jgi:hypothetical protein
MNAFFKRRDKPKFMEVPQSHFFFLIKKNDLVVICQKSGVSIKKRK